MLEPSRQPWIVALTASAIDGAREECLGTGMDDFLGKPVRSAEIEQLLDKAQRHKRGA